jgi:predicted thioesterase
MTASTPAAGATTTLTIAVTGENIASALAGSPDERYPSMFATPFMIAAMERACGNLLTPLLSPGDLSVGARIEVSHVAPTPVGETVTVTATFAEFVAPLYWFDVKATDRGGTIGKGRIARAIVKDAHLTARAKSRLGG